MMIANLATVVALAAELLVATVAVELMVAAASLARVASRTKQQFLNVNS